MSETASVAVVGGGVLGLTLALRLADQGHRVTVLEAAPATGGLASAEPIGGYTWDRFYHVILLSDTHLRGLLGELGLEDAITWRATGTSFYVDGTLVPFSSTLDFLRFPPLSLVDKARLAATILYASRIRDSAPLERIPATEWLRKLSGPRTYDRIWLPLLKAKLGENHRAASAAFIWATIARMYAARRSGMKRELFGHVEGGYGRVLEALNRRVAERGIRVQCGAPVSEVRASGSSVLLTGPGSIRGAYDHAVLTVPAGRVSSMVPALTGEEHARLRGITYQGITCASMLLGRPLGTSYITNITEPGIPFTAVIEMTALVDPRTFGGQSLVYLPRYLSQDSAFWDRSDDEIRETFLAGVARMYPEFRMEDVRAFRVARARDVLALPTLDYTAKLLPPTRTSVPGVYIANSAQIASGTLNLNETVALASRKARELGPLLQARVAERVA